VLITAYLAPFPIALFAILLILLVKNANQTHIGRAQINVFLAPLAANYATLLHAFYATILLSSGEIFVPLALLAVNLVTQLAALHA